METLPVIRSVQRQMLELIEGWLRHKSDMVNLEAARAICEMKGVTAAQLTKPIAGMLSLTKGHVVPEIILH